MESYQKREMRIEHIINKFRFLLLLFIALLDFIGHFTLQDRTFAELPQSKGWMLFLILLPLLLIVHYKTRQEKYFPWVKYLMILVDLSIGFLIGLSFILAEHVILPVSKLEFILMVSFLLIFINTLTVLRLHDKTVIYSSVLTIIANAALYLMIRQFLMAGIYTSLFIFFFSVFNAWVINYFMEYYKLNNKLGKAFNDLQEANKQINQKNEEITTQNELIHKHYNSLKETQKSMSDSLRYAQKIQKALFTHHDLLQEYFSDHFVFFKPKEKVSGDFSWATLIDNKLIVVVSDCTGHGVPGAFMTILGFSYLSEIVNAHQILEPDKILNKLRQYIISSLHQEGKLYEPKDGMDISVVQLDFENNKLKFSGANTTFCFIPKLNDKDNQVLYEFKGDRMPVSYHYKMRPFSLLEITYQKGDKIYLYTDGYIDQFGGSTGKKFKSVSFRRMLEQNHFLPMEKQKSILDDTMNNWLSDRYEQIDDMTVIGFEI
ncbi:MAG: PP2C family protein-serine/threonine phosphatase [Bacteroidota bacterium]